MTGQNVSVPTQLRIADPQPEVQHIGVQAPGRWFKSLPALAGIGYGVAWLAGLAAWPSNPAIDASKREIVSLYAANMGQAAAQFLVVEGLAGALLGIVLFYSIRRVSRCDPTWTSKVAVAAGVVVAISLLQSLLGLFLVFSASKGHLSQSGDIYQLFNRLDGVKQLLLGVCVVILGVLLRTTSNYPQRLMRTTVMVGIALGASGLSYLLLWNALAGTAFVSLPLLILWVAGTGIWLGAESQSGLGAGRSRVGAPGSEPVV
jgi:chromate transport protein ChrA